MRNHYIPQKYLLRFADLEGGIWVHDNQKPGSYRTGSKVIANEIGMYSDEVEVDLNLQVEVPSHRVFEKILACLPLSDADRHAVAKYVVVMFKRVPTGRDRALQRIPEVADEVHANLLKELDAIETIDPAFSQRAAQVRCEASEIIDRVKKTLPPSIWYDGFNLNEVGMIEAELLSMNWVFLRSKDSVFLTSDNPVFFFEHEGIGSPESELTFPISSSVALWATKTIKPRTTYARALPKEIREINRRTAYSSRRFIFSNANEPWIKPFTVKGNWPLSRLR